MSSALKVKNVKSERILTGSRESKKSKSFVGDKLLKFKPKSKSKPTRYVETIVVYDSSKPKHTNFPVLPKKGTKFEDVPVEWKLPHSLADLASKYTIRNFAAPFNKRAMILGLDKAEWQKVFQFLPTYDELKNARFVCRSWNYYISTWEAFAQRTRLVLDGRKKVGDARLSSFLNETWAIPYYQFLRLDTAKASASRFWLGKSLIGLTTLELKNCVFNWFDFIEILALFPQLTSLSVVVTKGAKGGTMKYFSLFIHGLHLVNDGKDTFEFDLSKSENYSMIDMNEFERNLVNLKFLYLDVIYVEFTNIFIQFLTLAKCCSIKEMRIILDKDTLVEIPPEIQDGKALKCPVLMTNNEFLRNNRKSLKKLHVTFGDKTRNVKLCEISEMIKNCALHLEVLRNVFKPGDGIYLNLDELGLDLGVFSIYGEKMKQVLKNSFDRMRSFFESQVNLKKLYLRDWCWPNDENKQTSTLRALIPNPTCIGDIGLFVLGGFSVPYCPNWNDYEDLLTSIKIQWEICNIRRLKEVMPEGTHEMPRVTNFELLNNLPICFVNFDVQIIVNKFPNLKRLHLEDIDQPYGTKSVLCVKGHRIEPAQFHDSDLQLIFGNLVKLEELFIKTRMYPVTDFAFTGVDTKQCRHIENIIDYDQSAVVGYRLGNLKHLKSLVLIGLSYKVTDITAFNAFNDVPSSLAFLDFITSGFTRNGRKFLRQKFATKAGFRLSIGLGKPKMISDFYKAFKV